MIQSSNALFLLEFVSVSLEYLLDELQLRHNPILFRGQTVLGHIIQIKVMDYPIKAVSGLSFKIKAK